MAKGEVLLIADHGVPLEIGFEACRLYHGEDSIGGLALGFRLVRWALARLSPDAVPNREDIAFATAFPGPGLRDAVEMTTRAVSRGVWRVLSDAPLGAPEGVYGRMYFEVTLGDRTLPVMLSPGALPEDFVLTGRRVKAGGADPELLRHWTAVKHGLAEAILCADPDAIFLPLKVRAGR
ncbi:MAG: hypothetical protein MR009_01390 [Sutterellaceae bacterium]|nr:hypothetical protein [Sutterellaceae bacterium]MDD7443043.1 hypothetical protein [Sutterellaceae bacterium]MDY2867936.1 hypothetical protein [Mesosutterella sp.]